MKTETVIQFIDAINNHDLEAMLELMSVDHKFVNAPGTEITGRENVKTAWKNYFNYFPDYTIEIDKLVHHNDTIAAFGFSSGTFNSVTKAEKETNWKIPTAWKIVVDEEKIKHWQVFADTKIPFDSMEKYSKVIAEDTNKVLGFGGVFFKSKDTKALTEWYDKHLGTNFGANTYSTFKWRERDNPHAIGRTEFSIFSEKSDYFSPSEKPFMFNFRVRNLDKFLEKLKTDGVIVNDKIERHDYGNFGRILDLEGNKIEIWEPVDQVLEEFEVK